MPRIGPTVSGSLFVALLWGGAAAAAEAPAGIETRFPHRTITNGLVTLTFYLPAGEKGYYVGTRFDPSGVVARATYEGHTFFGPWRRRDPNSQDHIMGTAEEFSMENPPGFDEVEAGGVFYKIGVGELIKHEKPTRDPATGAERPAEYLFHAPHKVSRRGQWKVSGGKDWVQFDQDFRGRRGWRWQYTKRVSLAAGAPSFTITRVLSNMGGKAIDTTHYCHNFTIIDGTPAGPAYVVHLPFDARARELKGDAIRVAERKITFVKALAGGRTVWADLAGMRGIAFDNAALIENRRTGAYLKITGDRPVVQYRFWAAEKAVCPKPFVAVKVAPGGSMTWSNTYTFQVVPPVGSR